MTEQEARILAAEIEGNRYWLVYNVAPDAPDNRAGGWHVHLIHRDLQRGILLYDGGADDARRIREGAIPHHVANRADGDGL